MSLLSPAPFPGMGLAGLGQTRKVGKSEGSFPNSPSHPPFYLAG